MIYAIETKDLSKKYPSRSRKKEKGRAPRALRENAITSFTSIFDAITAIQGPFIEALSDVDLQVEEGEVFGILGPNGAGKTTLIKILCTLVLHDKGEVYVNGYEVQRQPSMVLETLQAVLPGSRGFTWRLTGRQNLEFYALLYGLDKGVSEKRIDFLLKITGLEDRADDSFQRFSTGMQRKLLLCRGLLKDTPIVLFDEPTTGLDPFSASEFRRLIREQLVGEEGKTILLSTHNLREAQEICDRIAILNRGKITVCDTPNNIRSRMFEENRFNVTLHETPYRDSHESMLDKIEVIPGVYGVTPEISPENDFISLSFTVDKNMDLSQIMEVLLWNKLKIKALKTEEPTLEDAFIAITGSLPAQPDLRRRKW
jgi:ABC-2 type transport system ATP-binding protein